MTDTGALLVGVLVIVALISLLLIGACVEVAVDMARDRRREAETAEAMVADYRRRQGHIPAPKPNRYLTSDETRPE